MILFFIQDCALDQYLLLPVGRVNSVAASENSLVFEVFRIGKAVMKLAFNFEQFSPQFCEETDFSEYLTTTSAVEVANMLSNDLQACYPDRDRYV